MGSTDCTKAHEITINSMASKWKILKVFIHLAELNLDVTKIHYVILSFD